MMPVKSSDETQKLYFIAPDGTQHEFSGIQSVDTISDNTDDEVFDLSVKIADDLNRRIYRVAMMMLPNNFKRMHGLPLGRRIKRRRKKETKK